MARSPQLMSPLRVAIIISLFNPWSLLKAFCFHGICFINSSSLAGHSCLICVIFRQLFTFCYLSLSATLVFICTPITILHLSHALRSVGINTNLYCVLLLNMTCSSGWNGNGYIVSPICRSHNHAKPSWKEIGLL